MTRIEATHFIEQYDGGICGMQNTKVSPIDLLSETLKHTESKRYLYTTAIFLIKPSNLSLEERMEAREKKVPYEENFCPDWEGDPDDPNRWNGR